MARRKALFAQAFSATINNNLQCAIHHAAQFVGAAPRMNHNQKQRAAPRRFF
jgi:hypothetical protein